MGGLLELMKLFCPAKDNLSKWHKMQFPPFLPSSCKIPTRFTQLDLIRCIIEKLLERHGKTDWQIVASSTTAAASVAPSAYFKSNLKVATSIENIQAVPNKNVLTFQMATMTQIIFKWAILNSTQFWAIWRR